MGERHLLALLRAAVERYDMIPPGSHVAVGVSGGKDSLTLLYLLRQLQGFLPASFSLTAVTLDPCFEGQPMDVSGIRTLCDRLEVPFVCQQTNLWEVVFAIRRESNPCSLCARMRRGMLHSTAQQTGCDTVALGHHKQDAAETFLMNLLHGGTVGCFAPCTYLDRRDLRLIRPMVLMDETEIAAFAAEKRLPVLPSRCPVDGCTGRRRMREAIQALSVQYGAVDDHIIAAMQKANISRWGWSGEEKVRR